LGGVKNIPIFLAFVIRPGFDERHEERPGHAIGQLELMGESLITSQLPLLPRPSGKELDFRIPESHGRRS